MDKYIYTALALANINSGPNGKPWDISHIEGCRMRSDACSGGLSLFYKIFMKQPISCHEICILHDFLYSVGGSELSREFADILLRYGAANSGNFKGLKGFLRRIWRWFRSKVMYKFVRIAGWYFWSY